jgi:hypothetical protein
MNRTRFNRRLFMVLFLVWLQRAVRLSLRAAWLGLAGYLLGWSANSLWGWLPAPNAWLVIGLILGCLPLLGFFYPWPRVARLAWRLDRQMGLHEQISAAQQVPPAANTSRVAESLRVDAAGLLSKAGLRVALRGWFLEREVISTAVVTLLFWLIFVAYSAPAAHQLPAVLTLSLVPLGQDPTVEQIFPGGIPGLTPELLATLPAESSAEASTGRATEDGSLSPDQLQAVMAALQNLGRKLSRQAVSYDMGQALQRGDLPEAARAAEALADQAGELSEVTSTNLAEALQEAAEQLAATDQTGQFQSLTEALEAAAQALRSETGETAQASADRLDEVAGALRELAEQVQGEAVDGDVAESGEPQDGQNGMDEGATVGRGAAIAGGHRERGEPQPVERLQGEGQLLELSAASNESGALRPGRPPEAGSTTVSGALELVQATGEEMTDSTALTPYYYPWNWRNVVSNYFTPR